MKFSLTISDMTADQVSNTMNAINGTEHVETLTAPVTNVTNVVSPVTGETATIETPTPEAHAEASATINNAMLTAPATDTAVVDTNGFPWDKRIHSGKKADPVNGVKKDGTWKRRKGITDELIQTVEAELSVGTVAPVVTTPVPPITPSIIPVAEPVAPTPPVMPQAPAQPVAVTPEPVIATVTNRDFAGLTMQISKLFSTGQVQPDYPQTIVTRINEAFQASVTTLSAIGDNAKMVDYAWQCLDVDGKAV